MAIVNVNNKLVKTVRLTHWVTAYQTALVEQTSRLSLLLY